MFEYFADASFDLSKTLCISIEIGDNGPFLRINRKTRWICLSIYAWNGMCRNVDAINNYLLHQMESKIDLTKDKEVKIVKFLDKYYVSFVQTSKHNGKMYTNYINFNTSEWSALLYSLPGITGTLQGQDVPNTLIPEKEVKTRDKQSNCSLCKGKMNAVITYKHLMHKKTKLKDEDYKNVQDSNETAYNQMAYLCPYCGTSICDECCHCHRFDCRQCEPANFCEKCEEIIVYQSKYSDL